MKRHCRNRVIVLSFVGLIVLASGRQAFYADSRDTWRDISQQPEKVMEVIGIKQGMVIGEPGAGEGYFTFKLARKVGPTGKIYANDIDDKCLRFIDEQVREQGLKNIVTIKGKVEDPLFPVGQMDMVFMSDVVHDLEKPVEFLKNLKPAFKPGAPLVIIEQDPEKHKEGRGHFFSKDKLLEVVKSAGYTLEKIETFLSFDNIYIFRL